jgi:hypothetical protein
MNLHLSVAKRLKIFSVMASTFSSLPQLYERLTDVPTPDGSTPRELTDDSRRELPVIFTISQASSPSEKE